MSSFEMFPTLLYTGKLPVARARKLNNELLHEVQVLSDMDEAGHRWSKKNYLGGYTSYSSLGDLHKRSPVFAELEKLLAPHVAAFAKDLEWDLGRRKLQMTTCWMNIMPQNTYHTLHLHPLSVLSGTYYLQVPKGSSALKIEDPRMPYLMAAPARKAKTSKENQYYYHHQPKPGEFILFESWVRHEVPPNQSKTPRVSISFNFE
jgi:uncharacterized protein (TIGR02466 family)